MVFARKLANLADVRAVVCTDKSETQENILATYRK